MTTIYDLDPQDYKPFDGDGRRNMKVADFIAKLHPKAQPAVINNAAARRLIDQFNERWEITFKDPSGPLVWVIVAWAYSINLDLKVVKHPFGGWWIQALVDTENEVPAATPEPPSSTEEDDWSAMLRTQMH